MNTAQRLIKWLAVAFAVLLVWGVVTAIAGGGMLMSYIWGDWHDDEPGSVAVDVDETVTFDEIDSLQIEVKATSLVVKQGEKFQLLARDGAEVTTRRNGRTLKIEERNVNFWGWNEHREIILVLPEDAAELTSFRLEAGAGRIEVRDVATKQLDVKFGAGRGELNGVVASERAKINSGAGHLVVRESELHNLEFEMGAGKVALGAKLVGQNEIDAGVGKLELQLIGPAADYQLRVETGLGAFRLNGEKIGEGYYGDGGNLVKIDGGVGSIDVYTEE